MQQFNTFKTSKRLKLGSKPNEFIPSGAGKSLPFLTIALDKELYSAFERSAHEGRYILERKQRFNVGQHGHVTRAQYSATSKVLALGLSNGSFSLFNLDSLEPLHAFSISEHKITAVELSASGDWIALASSALGELLVWDWRSETCKSCNKCASRCDEVARTLCRHQCCGLLP